MRIRLIAATLALIVLTGCGAPTVTFNRAEFAIAYADAKAAVAVWVVRLDQGCREKKLGADVCKKLEEAKVGLRLLDEQAKAAIRQADREVDWATIGKYAEIAIGLVAQAAL